MGNRTENEKVFLSLWRGEGNEQALDKLIRLYEARVFTLALYLGDCDMNTAYEITADTFAETLADFKASKKEGLSVHVFSRVIHKCRHAKATLFFDPLKFIPALGARENILRTAKNALKTLPFEQKAMLLLRDQAHLSYDEMASILNVPARDIKIQTWQARNHFREKIEELLDRKQGL